VVVNPLLCLIKGGKTMSDLIRFNDPFAGLVSLHSQLDDMFNGFLTNTPLATSHGMPSLDVFMEDDKDLVAEIQAPGFDKNDIDIHVRDSILEIRGEKHEKEEKKDKKRSYVIRESNESFYRSIALPKGADADHMTAHFDNGILRVTVPFKELPQPKKVAISSDKKNR
jgi:HSP20 family protein